jgi:hypothetical protein
MINIITIMIIIKIIVKYIHDNSRSAASQLGSRVTAVVHIAANEQRRAREKSVTFTPPVLIPGYVNTNVFVSPAPHTHKSEPDTFDRYYLSRAPGRASCVSPPLFPLRASS